MCARKVSLIAITLLGLLGTPVAMATEFDKRAREAIQEALIWAAGYDGLVDGDFGKGTVRAIRNFQAANGFEIDGDLTATQAQRLIRRADQERRRFGFEIVTDSEVGISLGLPKALVTRKRASRRGNTYSSADGGIEIDTLLFSEREVTLPDLFERISKRGAIKTVNYSMLRENKFVVSGDDGASHYYFMALRGGGAVRAFSLSFSVKRDLRAITVAMANSLRIGLQGAQFAAAASVYPDRTGSIDKTPFVDRRPLLALVDGFLSEAGITAYKVLPAEPGNDDPHLRWAYEDGAMGELLALRPGGGLSLVDLANLSIERQAKACKGEFASARLQSRYFKGSEVQRVETRCQSGDNRYAVNFSIIMLPNGAMLRFGSITPAAAGQSEKMNERATNVENAAMVYVGTDRLR